MGNLGSMISGLVALPFLAIAVIFFILWLRGRSKVKAAQDWPSASGKVLFATVESRSSHSSSGGYSTSYYPSVVYEYNVNGQTYQNNRVTLGSEVGRGSYNSVQAKVASYPPGSTVTVFYNPENPLDATLEKSAPASKIFLFVAVLILVILGFTFAMMGGVNSMISGLTSQFPR